MPKENSHIENNKIKWGKNTLLLVDDDYASFLLVQELLSETKIHIIEGRTGKEAISVFQSNKNIDIVLLDIKLPGIDGFEVCKQMRKINPKIPIIAHTALNLHTLANKSNIDCFDDILLKPICFESLFGVLNNYLT